MSIPQLFKLVKNFFKNFFEVFIAASAATLDMITYLFDLVKNFFLDFFQVIVVSSDNRRYDSTSF